MSSRSVSIENMADAIMEELTSYADLAADDMKTAVKKAGKKAQEEIKASAPRKTGAYAKSWAVKTTSESSSALEVTVYSKNRYQIAHLLEHGHAKRGGGRVAARPHVAAAEEAAIEQLEQDIERSLRDG